MRQRFAYENENPFLHHPENRPVTKAQSATATIIRGGRPVRVRARVVVEFGGDSWGWKVEWIRFIGTRRRYRLTYREEDRCAFTALAAVA